MRTTAAAPNTVEAAVAYVNGTSPFGQPMRVIPVRGKVPLIPWRDGRALETEQKVREVWAKFPAAGIAVLLGGSGLLVLDVDGIGHGGIRSEDEVLADVEEAFGILPPTLTAITPGQGRHLFFAIPDGVDATAFGKGLVHPTTGQIVPGCDVKGGESGQGGYVVVPVDLGGATVDGRAWGDLADPARLPARIRPPKKTVGRSAPPLAPAIAEGGRNTALTSIAGSIRRRGGSEGAILAALRVENADRCSPPLPDADVQQIARSVARYEPADPASSDPPPPPPLPAGMDGAAVLEEVAATVSRFVVLPSPEAVVAVTLFVAHTHGIEASDVTPYLWITSPERRSGKTLLMELLADLVARPMHASSMTAAVIYRGLVADGTRRTLLLDEVDTVFGSKTTETAEALRSVLNAGTRRRSSAVMRVNGNTGKVETFDSYAAKVLAGIGDIPDTVADRSIRIAMRRARQEEKAGLAYAGSREVSAACDEARALVARWATDFEDKARLLQPEPLQELNPRANDAWAPLLSIADIAGGDWPARARAAAVALSGEREAAAEEGGLALRLLHDCQEAFHGRERLASADLVASLRAMPDSPWLSLDGAGLDANKLSRLLRRYEIRPEKLRLTGYDEPMRGYRRADFVDPWARYAGLKEDDKSATPFEGRKMRNIPMYAGDSGRNMPGTCSDPPERGTGRCSGPKALEEAVVPPVPAIPEGGGERSDETREIISRLTPRQADILSDIVQVVEGGEASADDPAGIARASGGITESARDFRLAYDEFRAQREVAP